MEKENKKNKKNRRRTIYSVVLLVGISLALILFDIYMCNLCVRTLEQYNEMVMRMPIVPNPEYLIGELVCIIAFMCMTNTMAGFAICAITKKEFELFTQFEPSEYQIYLSGLIDKLNENGNEDKIRDKKDVIQRMLDNNKEITEYFQISKKQEKFSYRISMACAIIGAIILFSSIGAIFFNKGIELTVVTILSGAITELVSGVVLWIHNKSATQLNFYYNSLHENEKILSAINMVDRLNDDNQKSQMYMEIIKAQIRAGEENKENENNS